MKNSSSQESLHWTRIFWTFFSQKIKENYWTSKEFCGRGKFKVHFRTRLPHSIYKLQHLSPLATTKKKHTHTHTHTHNAFGKKKLFCLKTLAHFSQSGRLIWGIGLLLNEIEVCLLVREGARIFFFLVSGICSRECIHNFLLFSRRFDSIQ